MNKRVLCVDDEPNVLAALQRTLRGQFEVETSEDPKRAIELLGRKENTFAVVVSDMRMPGINGVELLETAKRISPDTVRVMLTGNADQQTAVAAVNKGEIFRFLNKPVDPEILRSVLTLGIRQYELITAEREVLEQTLNGSVKVLTEMLAIVKPEVFGRTDRVRAKAKQVAARLGVETQQWELETTVSLALLGCVGLRPELLEKVLQGAALTSAEKLEYAAHPLLAADLIKNIPRMSNVADALLYQHKHFDGAGFPVDSRKGAQIPIASRILHVVLAYDELKQQAWSDVSIYEKLRQESGRYDPKVLEALGGTIENAGAIKVLRLPLRGVKDGMTIQEDVKTTKGMLLVCQGQVVTPTVRQHLMNFIDAGLLDSHVLVTDAARPTGNAQ